jgi:hypothetical protein
MLVLVTRKFIKEKPEWGNLFQSSFKNVSDETISSVDCFHQKESSGIIINTTKDTWEEYDGGTEDFLSEFANKGLELMVWDTQPLNEVGTENKQKEKIGITY